MASSKRPRELTTNPNYGIFEQPSATRRKITNVPSIVIVPNSGESPSISRVEVVSYPPSDVSSSTLLDIPYGDPLSLFQGATNGNQQRWNPSPSPSPPWIHTLSLESDVEMDSSVIAGKLVMFSNLRHRGCAN